MWAASPTFMYTPITRDLDNGTLDLGTWMALDCGAKPGGTEDFS